MSVNYTDPFAVWKNFYEELEPKVSESFQQFLGSEAYAALSAQMLSASLQMEHLFTKNVEALQQIYKMPSLKDIERLGEILIGLEEKIDSLDERLIKLEQTLNKVVLENKAVLEEGENAQKKIQKPVRNEKDAKN